MPEIRLSQGTIRYREQGAGPTVVLIHGVLVDGSVWDRVLPLLSAHARCIVPELPLGAHQLPVNRAADLSPPGLAALIAEFIERLELEDVTLVGNDTGGALCQLVVAGHPDRIGRLVLTNCDSFESFPPPKLKLTTKVLGRVPGAVALLAALGQIGPVRRAAMQPLTVDPIPDATVRAWMLPLRNPAIRHDFVKVLRGMSPEHTLAAAERLPAFAHPVLIVWGMRDEFFKVADAERLAALFADARMERIDNARTFVQLDAPEQLASLVGAFVAAPKSAAAVNGT